MRKLFTTAAVVILSAPALCAQEPSAINPCTEGTSPQQLACAEREFKTASDQLRRARGELYADLEPHPRAGFRAAERLWLRYRKSNCAAEASIYEGGTIQPLIELRCMARVTRERAAELQAQIQTLGGTDEHEN